MPSVSARLIHRRGLLVFVSVLFTLCKPTLKIRVSPNTFMHDTDIFFNFVDAFYTYNKESYNSKNLCTVVRSREIEKS